MQSHSNELLTAIEFREVGKYKEAQEWLSSFIELNPKNAEALSLLSQILLLDKKEVEAESALTAAAAINSELPSVYRNKARLLLKQSKASEALKRARLGCKQAPEDLESLLMLAACLGANQQDSEALSITEKLLRSKPDYAEAYANRVFIRLRAQDISGAIKDGETTVALKPHLTQMWSMLGSLHYQNNNLSAAIEALRNALKNEPKNTAFMIQLGEFLRQDNQVNEAISVLEVATDLDPEDANAWTNLGVVLQQGKKGRHAKIAYENALALNPKSGAILNNLGIMAKEAEEWESALRCFERSAEIEPNSVEAYNNMGNILQKLKEFQKAEALYRKAIELQPNYAEAHSNLGATLQNLNRFEEAEASYRQAIALQPNHPQAYSNLGATLQNLGRFEEAETSYIKAITLEPNHAEAYSNLGNMLKELGRFDEAEASYKKGIMTRNGDAKIHSNLGNMLKDLGRLNEAEESYKQAIELQPNFAEAHRHLALMRKFEAEDEYFFKMLELYHDDSISDEQRCEISFALAKACDDTENFEQAFKYYAEGNALRKKHLNYSLDQDIELFKQIKSVYEIIAKCSLQPAETIKSITPVFIVGMPRSGTTLVEQIISSHSQVTGAGELNFAPQFGSKLSHGLSKIDGTSLLNFRKNYLNELQNISNRNLIVTDKMPHNFLLIGLLAAALPEAKIVHVKRDPAAVCWANYKQYFTSKKLGYCYAIDDVINYHKLYENLMDFWTARLGERIYSLDYELLTVNQESETRGLIKYLSLEWDKNCLSPQNNTRNIATASNLQVRKKVYQGSSEQWKKYKPFLNGAFAQFAK